MTTPRDLLMIAMDVRPAGPSSRATCRWPSREPNWSTSSRPRPSRWRTTASCPARSGPWATVWTGPWRRWSGRDRRSVDDWLWRRGRGLCTRAYRADLEAEGRLARPRHRWIPFGGGRTEAADWPDRSHADERWTSGEPILTVLAAAVGASTTSRRRRPRVWSGRLGPGRTGRRQRRGDGTGGGTTTAKHRRRGLRQHLARRRRHLTSCITSFMT